MQKEIFIKNLRLIITDSYKEMSKFSSEIIFNDIKKKNNLLLCTATGSTPTATYDLLAEKYREKQETFKNIRIIKLDEWGGIPMNDPATCEIYLQEHLIAPLKIEPSRYISWNSIPDDPEQEVKQINKKFEDEGDIDLCILGMGINGHLGFNEPSDFLHPNAHIAKLAPTTKKHTMALKAKHSIKYGLTLGMNDIMRSKKILLLINGKHKEQPFKEFLARKITTQFPTTMLWMHPNVTIVCDNEVVPNISELKNKK